MLRVGSKAQFGRVLGLLQGCAPNSLQGAQQVELAAPGGHVLYVPALQGRQVVALGAPEALLKNPAGQRVHMLAPARLYEPGAHAEHEALEEAPNDARNRPAEQGTQAARPSTSEYVPALQRTGGAAPPEQKNPLGHATPTGVREAGGQ